MRAGSADRSIFIPASSVMCRKPKCARPRTCSKRSMLGNAGAVVGGLRTMRLKHVAGTQWSARKYMNMDPLREMKPQHNGAAGALAPKGGGAPVFQADDAPFANTSSSVSASNTATAQSLSSSTEAARMRLSTESASAPNRCSSILFN